MTILLPIRLLIYSKTTYFDNNLIMPYNTVKIQKLL